MAKYRSREMENKLIEQLDDGKIDVVVCDFLMPSINMPDNINIPTVLFQHNVEAMIWKRHYEVAANTLKKEYLKRQWERTLDYEKRTCLRFDRVISVSEEDSVFFSQEYKVKNAADVPTGVDTEYSSG